jgi:Protein of unknown function (DUF3352)
MRAPMRRLLSILLVLSALVAAGCGGGDSGDPLDVALSHLPRDAVFAAALDTDVEGDQYEALDTLLKKFTFGDQVREQVQQQLEAATDGRFDEDARPLLGNPAVVGATRVSGAQPDPIVALQVEDEDKLEEVIERDRPRELGEVAGATLYREDDASVFAVEGDVVVFASNRRTLSAALQRADGDDHLDEDTFNEALDGLPEDALVRLYADVRALIEDDPGSGDARAVKWVGALRTLGLTATAKRDAIDVDFRLRTEGDLTDEDLPIAPGDEAPGVIAREGEVGLGIRDLAHFIRFAESAGQAIDPAGFGDYAQAKRTIDRQLGVSLDDDLIGQLTGDVSASVALDGGFGVRAELDDPQAFERTLAKVSDVLPSFAQGAGFGEVELAKPRRGEDFYELTQAGGGTVVFGVVDEVLVVASDRGRAGQLAAEEPSDVSGARGSVVLGADAEQLGNVVIEEFGQAFGVPDLGGFGARLITGPLGELDGYASASTGELRGKLTLAFD